MPLLPQTMKAVVTTGVGGYDKLSYVDRPLPRHGPGEVLVRVLAAGVNNTEINTRLGWYSATVETGTESTSNEATGREDGGWSAATPFPFIQGTDCCGRVEAVGDGVDPALIGRRVLVRACMRPRGFDDPETIWMGSDFDGAFAQFVKVPGSEVFPVDTDWSDAELATLPCAHGTAENMIHRAGVRAGQRVLIPGASGGVGSAAVQLCARRGAEVIAVTSPSKRDAVAALGAATVLNRDDDLVAILGEDSVDVALDNVVGDGFATCLALLRRAGTYVSSGAIAGPVVSLDIRTVYLKDLRIIGCTGWDAPIFPNLIGYIERGEIRPLLHATYPLERIAQAQQDFIAKNHIGNLVLLPPG